MTTSGEQPKKCAICGMFKTYRTLLDPGTLEPTEALCFSCTYERERELAPALVLYRSSSPTESVGVTLQEQAHAAMEELDRKFLDLDGE